jgi:(p)ppGpp synthase/HD superfamily hydrolase
LTLQELIEELCGDMSTLENAIIIAAAGHAGVLDKAGAPYILHSLRVMLAMTEATDRIVAVLHDVIEDCDGWTLDRIRSEGFSDEVVEALDSVTKRDGEEYLSFVGRAAANPIGGKVKLADLRDNSNLARISNPTQRDFDRIEKYRNAIEMIERMDSPP